MIRYISRYWLDWLAGCCGRPRHSRLWAWLIMLCLTLVLGYEMGRALHWTQLKLGEAVTDGWSHRLLGPKDPYRSRTAIGHVGELKGSDSTVITFLSIR